jgi:hypothetical protein
MNKLLIALALFGSIALLPALVHAEGAEWIPVKVFFSWDWSMGGFCAQDNQCLLHSQGNSSYDGDSYRWFTLTEPSLLPRCMNHTQSVLDYRCENSNWTTRTKHVALQLLKVAEDTSPTNFTLFCDTYDRVLNRYEYLVQSVMVEHYLKDSCTIAGVPGMPCINSMCVLQTPTTVALGTTLNIPLNHPQTSFLRALNKTPALCSGVSSTVTTFAKCNPSEPVWYNPAIDGVIWLATGTLTPPTESTAQLLSTPLAQMSAYVMNTLHVNNNPGMNFAYFPKTRLFNHVYVAKNAGRSIFGVLELNLRPEFDPVPLDYIGVRYEDIDFGADPCLNYVKKYDTKAFCENQTGLVNVVARHRCEEDAEFECPGASPIVNVWPALTGKLRP